MVGQKWCTRCACLHDLSEFYKSNYTLSGYRSECKQFSRRPYEYDRKIKAKSLVAAPNESGHDRELVIDALIGAGKKECCWLVEEIVHRTELPGERVQVVLDELKKQKLVVLVGELHEPTDALYSQNKIAA